MRSFSTILITALLFTLCGCSSGEEEKARVRPSNVLTKDSMAYYLSQVHVMEAVVKNREVRKKGLQDEARKAFVNYFDTASVSESRFKASLEFWKDDFESMQEIYDLSMERLSTKMARVKQQKGIEEEEEEFSKPPKPKTRVQAMKDDLSKRHGTD